MLKNARKLGFLSLLLTSAVVVVTVMLLDLVFTGWSIVYFVARIPVIPLIPLIQLLALTIVQLILQTEGEFVLPKFCRFWLELCSSCPITMHLFLETALSISYYFNLSDGYWLVCRCSGL